MRPPSRLSRSLTALFALWFAVVLGDPGVLHACAMHGGTHGSEVSAERAHSGGRGGMHDVHGASEAPAEAVQQSGHGGHDGHAGHGGHGAHGATGGAEHGGKAPGPCTCVGHCCAASAAASIPVVEALEAPAVVAAPRAPRAAPSDDAPASPDLRLPFANGPPRA
jgi:hypothetical protein